MSGVVYKIQSKIDNTKFYIGSTQCSIKERMAFHLYQLKKNRHHSKAMQEHYNKYGFDDLEFEVLNDIKNTHPYKLHEMESSLINSLNPNWNTQKIATGTGMAKPIRYNIRIDHDLDCLIQRESKKNDLTLSEFIRMAIANYFNNLKK